MLEELIANDHVREFCDGVKKDRHWWEGAGLVAPRLTLGTWRLSLHFVTPNIENKVPRAGMQRRFRASRQLNLVEVVRVRPREIYVIAAAQVNAPSTAPYGGN